MFATYLDAHLEDTIELLAVGIITLAVSTVDKL